MANPLARSSNTDFPAAGLFEWCDEQNRKPLTEGMGRWYFIAGSDGVDRINTLTGTDGENVHRLLNGELPDFAGWPKARMDGYRKWLQECAQKGLLALPAHIAA